MPRAARCGRSGDRAAPPDRSAGHGGDRRSSGSRHRRRPRARSVGRSRPRLGGCGIFEGAQVPRGHRNAGRPMRGVPDRCTTWPKARPNVSGGANWDRGCRARAANALPGIGVGTLRCNGCDAC
ncbi:hypothetical protein NL676_024961 [Syzygium grande]|nr:hypothetical protein NL676_024961 [Syzygium grande]